MRAASRCVVMPRNDLSEGAGENLFVVKDGTVYTPPAAASILTGITRNTLMILAAERGIEVVEQSIPREMLYIADEIFMTGTATEVVPVRSVDGMQVGSGERGLVTEKVQTLFFGLFDGTTEDKYGWLENVADEAFSHTESGSLEQVCEAIAS